MQPANGRQSSKRPCSRAWWRGDIRTFDPPIPTLGLKAMCAFEIV